MAKIIPIFVERKNKPKVKAKQTLSRPFEKVWPSIMEDMVKHPNLKTKDLWVKWKSKIEDVFSLSDFSRLLRRNNITPSLVKSKTSIAAQAEVALSTFAAGKKSYAERHNERIHNKLEEIHNVVEKIPVNEENVIEVLEIVGRLQKEGRITYDIDQDKPVDKTVVNLALMMGFDPKQKPAIDV